MQKHLPLLLLFLLFSFAAIAQEQSGYPVYTTQTPPPFGLYKTSEDYLNLTPTDSAVIFVHIAQMDNDGFNNFYEKKSNGKKGDRIPPDEWFAGSDGKTFYISYAGKWRKAKRLDSGYCFIAPYVPAHDSREPHAHVVVGYGNDRTDYSAWVENNQTYRMQFSVAQRKWVPAERAKKLK